MKAIAFEVEKRLKCPMCGTAGWEWEANRSAYVAVFETCPGCASQEYLSQGQTEPAPGTRATLITVEEDAARRSSAAAAKASQERQDAAELIARLAAEYEDEE